MKNLFAKIFSVALSSAVLLVSFLSVFSLIVAPAYATNAQITISDSVDKAIADRGENLSYTIVVKNTGTTATTNTFLWINKPNLADYVAGSSNYIFTPTPNLMRTLTDSWITDGVNFGNMNPGETVTLHYQTKVAANANPDDIIWSVAAVKSDQTTQIQAQSFTKMVFKASALCGQKTADKTTVSVGDSVTFTVKVCNQSNINLTNIVIKDDLVSPFVYTKGTTVLHINNKDINIDDNWVNTSVNIGNLPAGTSATLTYRVTISNNLVDGQVLKNVAHISAEELENGIACEAVLKGKVLAATTTVTPPTTPTELPNTGPGETFLFVSALAPAGWILKRLKSKIK